MSGVPTYSQKNYTELYTYSYTGTRQGQTTSTCKVSDINYITADTNSTKQINCLTTYCSSYTHQGTYHNANFGYNKQSFSDYLGIIAINNTTSTNACDLYSIQTKYDFMKKCDSNTNTITGYVNQRYTELYNTKHEIDCGNVFQDWENQTVDSYKVDRKYNALFININKPCVELSSQSISSISTSSLITISDTSEDELRDYSLSCDSETYRFYPKNDILGTNALSALNIICPQHFRQSTLNVVDENQLKKSCIKRGDYNIIAPQGVSMNVATSSWATNGHYSIYINTGYANTFYPYKQSYSSTLLSYISTKTVTILSPIESNYLGVPHNKDILRNNNFLNYRNNTATSYTSTVGQRVLTTRLFVEGVYQSLRTNAYTIDKYTTELKDIINGNLEYYEGNDVDGNRIVGNSFTAIVPKVEQQVTDSYIYVWLRHVTNMHCDAISLAGDCLSRTLNNYTYQQLISGDNQIRIRTLTTQSTFSSSINSTTSITSKSCTSSTTVSTMLTDNHFNTYYLSSYDNKSSIDNQGCNYIYHTTTDCTSVETIDTSLFSSRFNTTSYINQIPKSSITVFNSFNSTLLSAKTDVESNIQLSSCPIFNNVDIVKYNVNLYNCTLPYQLASTWIGYCSNIKHSLTFTNTKSSTITYTRDGYNYDYKPIRLSNMDEFAVNSITINNTNVQLTGLSKSDIERIAVYSTTASSSWTSTSGYYITSGNTKPNYCISSSDFQHYESQQYFEDYISFTGGVSLSSTGTIFYNMYGSPFKYISTGIQTEGISRQLISTIYKSTAVTVDTVTHTRVEKIFTTSAISNSSVRIQALQCNRLENFVLDVNSF